MEQRHSAQLGTKRQQRDQRAYSTDRPGHLTQYQRTHTEDKLFRCTLCDKAFAWSSGLQIHQRIHTGEKPFRCTLCGKAFAGSSNFKRHQRTHNHQKIPKKWSLKSACESQSAAMSPSLMKPEVNPSLDTFKGIKVKCEKAKVKCEEMMKSEEVKVKCEKVMVKSEN
ncbi:zinc finger protein 93-like [Lethenteron reissneri]|uniref:zinc finger protein 93-like n=1 Tax=Lethenteron reissneri TaxID=7753 RepID=UPI002AB6CEFA|nr:zinc finger protein 93-like [Lethenteron reissneri]